MQQQIARLKTLLLLFAAVVGMALSGPAASEPAVTLTHIHGLAYSADGKQIFVPSHHGMAVYNDGHWTKAPGPQHDYMGFAATRERFYSSGHPAPGSGLRNPFGLIRSDDGGASWKKRGLEGESDFHLLATSYETHAVLVFNPHPNSRMPQRGLYLTLNDGFAWQAAEGKGLAGDISSLAVHPTDPKIQAAGTNRGVYLSRDAGASFEAVLTGAQGLALFFDLDGKHLWAGSYSGQPVLTRINLGSRQQTPIALPKLANDAVAYIAQNPKHLSEFAIATFERNVYLSRDGGKTWTAIAERGSTR